jgi:signal transduction histidine kinase
MGTLIRQLLQFGRRSRAERCPTDLRIIVRNTVALLTPIARTHQVGIKHHEPGDEVPALVNASEIEQVLSNLMMNAIQASPAGGSVCVQVGTRGPRMATILVADRGCGIARESLPRIFDPFFTTKDPAHGTGLGLSISHCIVMDHGGQIDVESREGIGSRFTVVLPIDRSPSKA